MASNGTVDAQTERKGPNAQENRSSHDIESPRIYDDVDLESYKPAFEVGAELGAKSMIGGN